METCAIGTSQMDVSVPSSANVNVCSGISSSFATNSLTASSASRSFTGCPPRGLPPVRAKRRLIRQGERWLTSPNPTAISVGGLRASPSLGITSDEMAGGGSAANTTNERSIPARNAPMRASIVLLII